MRLCIEYKGISEPYHIGYSTFSLFRKELARVYNKRLGEIYQKHMMAIGLYPDKVTEDEWKEWDNLCPKGLELLLFHSDCDGKLTPKECRAIYNDIKNLSMDEGNEYMPDLEKWKEMLLFCSKRRVNMYFY